MATRASTHNGRAGKKGAYSARHNDRDFDTSTTDHIDPTLTPFNKNVLYGGDFGAATNEQHELAFYAAHFGESLERKNAAYRSKGKAAQIKTLEQYYRSPKSCPEETLYTIGKDVNPELLWEIYQQHRAWKAETYPLCQTLNAALHVDEPNAMHHIHERSVWIGHDAQGMEVVGQAKALAEMGVLPPDPEAKYGKHNNAKQTFTRQCREHFLELCKAHGLEIIEEPLPKDKVGLELTEYKIQHAQERLDEIEQEAQKASEGLKTAKEEIQGLAVEKTALTASVERYRGVELDMSACAISAEPAKLRPGKMLVSETDLARLQEAAKAGVVAVAFVDDEKERLRNEVSERQKQLDQMAKDLEAKASALAGRERRTRDDWANLAREQQAHKAAKEELRSERAQLDARAGAVAEREKAVEIRETANATVHADLREEKVKTAALTSKVKELSDNNAALAAEIINLRKVRDGLLAAVKEAYRSLTDIVKAVSMMKYSSGDYRITGLTKPQGRLIDAIANYGSALAEKIGLKALAAEMQEKIGISEGLHDHIAALEKAEKAKSQPDIGDK